MQQYLKANALYQKLTYTKNLDDYWITFRGSSTRSQFCIGFRTNKDGYTFELSTKITSQANLCLSALQAAAPKIRCFLLVLVCHTSLGQIEMAWPMRVLPWINWRMPNLAT
eukprot:TRINITY_DN5923_c1_g1_i1.p1 TRINITY_DN5923_c1_g1~~TRINITY_DN5923_c1_g1_i1.p1  ORF type:complete len:111 (-),score=8.33 TRINITY_DN5923_c1_g1_i1:39-371(-)